MILIIIISLGTYLMAGILDYDPKPIRKDDVYTLHNGEKGKKEFIKLFSNDHLEKHGLKDALQFNKEVLKIGASEGFLFPDSILPLKDCYITKKGFILIVPSFQDRLDQYIERKGKLEQKQVMGIAQNIVKGLYSLHDKGYLHANIRAEHLVYHEGKWKFQSFVYNQEHPLGLASQYLWSNKHQSPESYSKSPLSRQELSEKAVWNFGALIIHMLLGQHRLKDRDQLCRFKNQPFSFEKIKVKAVDGISAALKKILGKMCHFDSKQRMKLAELFACDFFSKEVAKQHLKNLLKNNVNQKDINLGPTDGQSIRDKETKSTNLICLGKCKIQSCRHCKTGIANRRRASVKIQSTIDMILNANRNQQNPQIVAREKQLVAIFDRYKNELEKGEILVICYQKLQQLYLINNPEIAYDLVQVTRYALHFVKAMDLSELADGLNYNINVFKIDTPQWQTFLASDKYKTLKEQVNFQKQQAIKKWQQIRKNILLRHNPFLSYSELVNDFVTNKLPAQCTFSNIKVPYREIIKQSYDCIVEQYSKDKTQEWATLGMYITFCLAIDKLYIPEKLKSNFKYYFYWSRAEPTHYIPMKNFQRYLQTADKDLLIENTAFIMKEFFSY